MKKLPLIVCMLFCSFIMSAQNSIQFENTEWNQIIEKAQKENKIIFLDAYAEWCGPCKWMAKNTFTNNEVAGFYNEKFVNAKIDMEKGEGIDLAKKYNVRAYPTLLFISPDGNIAHRACGAADPAAFIKLGEAALDNENNFAAIKAKYESGNVDAEFINHYARTLQMACLPADDVVSEYLSGLPEEKLYEKQYWQLMRDYVKDYDSKAFRYLMNNKDRFAEQYSQEEVNEKIFDVYQYGLFAYEAKNDIKGLDELKKKIRQTGHPDAEKIILLSEMRGYESRKQWNQYARVAEKYTKQYAWNDAMELNNIAWQFYENVDDKKLLAKGADMAKRSIELDKQYFNTDTYAAIQYKLGNKIEAANAAKEAIELAKKSNEDPAETEKLLEKINEL